LAETIEIVVSVRLLFMQEGEGDFFGEKLTRIAVDAAAGPEPAGNGGLPEAGARNWLFVLDEPFTPRAVTRIFSDPPPAERERQALEREARDTLGAAAGRISVETASDRFMDLLMGGFPSRVDEAV
jgi:hypothetical protein